MRQRKFVIIIYITGFWVRLDFLFVGGDTDEGRSGSIKPCAQPQYAIPNPSQIHRSVPFAYPAYK